MKSDYQGGLDIFCPRVKKHHLFLKIFKKLFCRIFFKVRKKFDQLILVSILKMGAPLHTQKNTNFHCFMIGVGSSAMLPSPGTI